MRELRFLIMAVTALSLSSCQIPREVLWDMVVAPFSGMDKEQVHDIDRFMPDCRHAQFEFNTNYLDSLRHNDKFYINTQSAQRGSFSLIQTRMYDSTGRIAGGYEICMGNAKFLGIFENMPLASNFEQVNEHVNRKVCFQNDAQFIVATEQERLQLLNATSEFDYTIMVLWPSSARYYTKRHLRQVRQYVKQFGGEYSFRVIYVHFPAQRKGQSYLQ